MCFAPDKKNPSWIFPFCFVFLKKANIISSSRGMTADCDHVTGAFKRCESSERGQHGGHRLAEGRGRFDSGLGVELARSPRRDALARATWQRKLVRVS